MSIFSRLFAKSTNKSQGVRANTSDVGTDSVIVNSNVQNQTDESGNSLPLILNNLVQKNGKEFLNNKYLVNILSDLHVFSHNRALKNIVSCLVENGLITKLVNISLWEVNHLTIIKESVKNYGLNEQIVIFVVKSVGFSLGYEKVIPTYKVKAQQSEELEVHENVCDDVISSSDILSSSSSESLKVNLDSPNEHIKDSEPKCLNPNDLYAFYKYPQVSLLTQSKTDEISNDCEVTHEKLKQIFSIYGIEIDEIKDYPGPSVTFYEIKLKNISRISRVRNNIDDISKSLSVHGARIMAPMPLTTNIAIEIPNEKRNVISLGDVICLDDNNDYELPLYMGMSFGYVPYVIDLASAPNILVSCSAYQGLSNCLNVIITSLLLKKHPNELKFVLINPRGLEFNNYSPVSESFMAASLGTEPILSDVKDIKSTILSITYLIQQRYDLLKKGQCKNIKNYNEKYLNSELDSNEGHDYMPYIAVVINEYGDLQLDKSINIDNQILEICKKGYTVGVHLIISTHRIDMMDESIIESFATRFCLTTINAKESKCVIGCNDATKLVGNGDMLIFNNNNLSRIQCAYIDYDDIDKLVNFIGNQLTPWFTYILPDKTDLDVENHEDIKQYNYDPLLRDVAHLVVVSQLAAVGLIRRHFVIGYIRTGRIMDQLQKIGVVGPAEGSKPRKIYFADEVALDKHLRTFAIQ